MADQTQDTSSTATEAKKSLRVVELIVAGCDRELVRSMDNLYNVGKEKGWPKEVMEYLMWWEHETIRLAWRLRGLDKEFRKISKELSCTSTGETTPTTTS